MVGPSANPSGRTSPTTAQHVREAFTQEQVLVLDGGPCRAGIESTVLTLAGPALRILRLGVISAEQIGGVLGRPVASPARDAVRPDPASPLAAPGQLPIHYAPAAPATLFDPSDLLALLARAPGPVAVLARSALSLPAPHTLIPMPPDAPAYAARLYAALREADALHPALIAIERPPATGPIWDAIADRLARATS
jgi:L-threonylcarbamoyladenylate synthase